MSTHAIAQDRTEQDDPRTTAPLLEGYPHREDVLRLAGDAAEAVDRGEVCPFDTLRDLGRDGLLALGREGSLLPQAAVVFDAATRCTSTAFSLWAHRSVVAFFDAVGRPLPEGLEDGTVTGSTAMAAAFKAASDVGSVQVRARREDDHLVLDGVVPWASNLYPEGVVVMPVVLEASEEIPEHQAIVALPVDSPGLEVTPMRDLLALESTRSGFSRLTGVRVPADAVLTEDVPGFLAAVTAPFLLLQASFCLGLSAAALDSAAPLRDSSHGVFEEDVDAALAEYETLREELLRLASAPSAADRLDVLCLRLAAAHLTGRATRLEMMLVGGRGYVATSGTARRFREAAFLPVQSPTEGHLRWEIHRSEQARRSQDSGPRGLGAETADAPTPGNRP